MVGLSEHQFPSLFYIHLTFWNKTLDTIEHTNLRFKHNLKNFSLKKVAATGISASNKSNLLRKVDFLLKIDFQVIAFFIPLEVGYLVI